MDKLFDICVQLMTITGHWLGLSYIEWNVWVFVFIHPAILLILVSLVFYYRSKTKKLKRKLNEQKRYHGGAVIY